MSRGRRRSERQIAGICSGGGWGSKHAHVCRERLLDVGLIMAEGRGLVSFGVPGHAEVLADALWAPGAIVVADHRMIYHRTLPRCRPRFDTSIAAWIAGAPRVRAGDLRVATSHDPDHGLP